MAPGADSFDPLNVPTYTYADAAWYLGLSASTVRAWARGTTYRASDGGQRSFEPVIELPNPRVSLLSFTNMVELHVLSAIRRQHSISLPKVRQALDWVQREFDTPHPLARLEFRTDGVDIFLDVFGQLLAVSGASGQLALREVVEAYMQRIERDERGIEARLYSFTRTGVGERSLLDEPKVVVIDPRVSFGRPVLVGTGIPTAVLAERYKAGESIEDLAADFHCPSEKIHAAIRCELHLAA